MGRFLTSVSAMLTFAIAGIVFLPIDKVYVAVIVFTCGLLNTGITSYLGANQKVTITSTVKPTE